MKKIKRKLKMFKFYLHDLCWKLNYRFVNRLNHLMTDLPVGYYDFDEVCVHAISKRFLSDYPNILKHSEKVEKALSEAKLWFEKERKEKVAIISQLEDANDWYTRCSCEMSLIQKLDGNYVLTNTSDIFLDCSDQLRKNILDILKLEKEIEKQDTKHLINLMKYRTSVSD